MNAAISYCRLVKAFKLSLVLLLFTVPLHAQYTISLAYTVTVSDGNTAYAMESTSKTNTTIRTLIM